MIDQLLIDPNLKEYYLLKKKSTWCHFEKSIHNGKGHGQENNYPLKGTLQNYLLIKIRIIVKYCYTYNSMDVSVKSNILQILEDNIKEIE